MYEKINKIPGGMLLVPMFISALINTIDPYLFKIGGISQAFLTEEGSNYIVGSALFFSGVGMDLKNIKKVLKKQASLIGLKTLICLIFSYLYIQFFGQRGIFVIPAMSFISIICSCNPSLYLVLVEEFGQKEDEDAFSLVGLLCTPAYALIIFSVAEKNPIDIMPIISLLIPFFMGLIVGVLDENFKKYFSMGMDVINPLMGWSFGASINLLEALRSGFQGILMTTIYYLLMIPFLLLFERKLLKEDGTSSLAMASVAGMSISIPGILADYNESLSAYISQSRSQIAMAMVLTNMISPFIVKKYQESLKGLSLNKK